MLLEMMFIVGVIFGNVFTYVKLHIKSPGRIRIDTSDPDGPYMFLELTEPVKSFMNEKQVLLDIDLENYLPRE
ncbi:MAG: hypothetical protein LUE29_09495 [Lachnospiraceae bacterium]|nr:hypothetical protein [Lachnospiraceae bacterium]